MTESLWDTLVFIWLQDTLLDGHLRPECKPITHLLMSIALVVFPQLDAGKQYQYTPPTQPPIRPPYEQACHLRKNNLLSREDTVSSCPGPSVDETEPPAEST